MSLTERKIAIGIVIAAYVAVIILLRLGVI